MRFIAKALPFKASCTFHRLQYLAIAFISSRLWQLVVSRNVVKAHRCCECRDARYSIDACFRLVSRSIENRTVAISCVVNESNEDSVILWTATISKTQR